MGKFGRERGFTLIEALVVVAIVVILQAIAVPRLSDWIKSMRLTAAANNVFSSLLLTRSEAIKRNSRAVMCKSFSGDACSTMGGWDQGWIIFHDANGNASFDAGEALVHRQQPLDVGLKVSGNSPVANYVSFTPMGSSRYISGAFQAGTLTVCNQSAAKTDARQLVIHSSGRPRIAKVTMDSCQ